jgi:hypothetical protein
MNADLADRIHECLLAAPMMTARQIGKTLSVDKHVINQTLYKSDRFENDGGRIPTWSAVVKQPELPEGAELVHYKGDILGYCLPGQLGINRIVVTP